MCLTGKTILVTGGGGFMGSHLCEALVRSGAKVKVIDNVSSGREANLNNIKDHVEFTEGDITDENVIKNACHGVDTIIHAAFPMALRQRSMETGFVVDFTTGLFNLLKETLANKALFVYISSIAVYGDQKYVPIDEKHPLEPVMLHGALKLSGEYLCRTLAKSHGLKTVILRVADIYGPRNTRAGVPVRFLINAMEGRPLKIFGSGLQKRTYTFVGDFVKAVLSVLNTPEAVNKIFNIASNQSISIRDLALLVKEITGSNSEIIIEKDVPSDDRQLVIDSTLAQNILKPGNFTSLREGLTITREWLRQNPDFYKRRLLQ